MKRVKRLSGMLLCIFLLASMSVPVCAAASVPKPVMKATESVVRVLAEYSDGYATGSGFVIKSDKDETLIATNYHVVEGNPYGISVWLGEEETVGATILAYTNQKDMCILRLSYPVALSPLTFAEVGARQGEAVFAVGFPSKADYLSDKEAHTGEDATITDGIVSAVREVTVSDYGTPTKLLQINAAINPGNSGGPLFNEKGEVVGINTYGINDSQGIFGAIDVSELKMFLADNSIPIPDSNGGFLWVILAVAGAIVCIAIALTIVVRKKKRMAPVKSIVQPVTLREYMESYPNGVGMNEAVAMLLPVALQLRDLHNNGSAHLQVSPNSITVGANGAMLAGATSAETDRYTSGYAAPEIYRGTSAGSLSDVYSFCAVLSYVATGKQPVNSLSRADGECQENESNQIDSSFRNVIQVGMALNPPDRVASMQEVIMKLSPYNVKPFTNSAVLAVEEKEPKKREKPKTVAFSKKNAVVVAATFVLVILGTYFGCYMGARVCAGNGNFSVAGKLLFASSITEIHDPKLVSYIDAGQLLIGRNYGEAKSGFVNLSGYRNADELAKEADYRHAVQYADANEFDKAIGIMSELSQLGYKDASTKLQEIQYRNGAYLLYEKHDYREASKIFSQLSKENFDGADAMEKETQFLWALDLIEQKYYVDAYSKLSEIRGYSDADEVLESLTELIYLQGKSLYYQGKYSDAEELFKCVSDYADSKKYSTLIEAHSWKDIGAGWYVPDGLTDKLISIFYFEDASELLLSYQAIAEEFLRGTWRGDGRYFTMEDDGHISYNLPRIDYGYYYKISGGIVYKYPKNNEKDTRKMFFFEAVTPDCIRVYCYKNNSSYTLYRQG